MIPHAEKLIARAQKGERLTTKERRHCLAFLMGTNDLGTNEAMAKLFGISERAVRLDKTAIREEKAKHVREEDVALVLADIQFCFETQIRDMERSKKKSGCGTRTYLEHCKSIFASQLQKVAALQNLGVLPKNLGQLITTKYEYVAHVTKDGSVETRPVDLVIDTDEVEGANVLSYSERKALTAPSGNDDGVTD